MPSPNICSPTCTKVTPDPTAGISAVPSFVKCAKVPRLNVSAATRVNYWLNQYDTSGQSKCTGSPAAAKALAPGASLHAGNGLWRSTACSGTSCAVSFCVGETQCAAGQALRVSFEGGLFGTVSVWFREFWFPCFLVQGDWRECHTLGHTCAQVLTQRVQLRAAVLQGALHASQQDRFDGAKDCQRELAVRPWDPA